MKNSSLRRSGILCHFTSLPSPFGVGDFGPMAYDFINHLSESGQSDWQVLPIGNTDDSGCTYATDSAFAGAPFLISLEKLVEQNLLDPKELDAVSPTVFNSTSRVNYKEVRTLKNQYLIKAFQRFKANESYFTFLKEEFFWIEDYALFSALKEKYGYNWKLWPPDCRIPNALTQDLEIRDRCEFHKFVQFIFFSQLMALKDYANQKGISLIGDLPLFVSYFSMDVWVKPERFYLSENFELEYETGAAPDAFSNEGQKWGTPIYNWQFHKKEDYLWWKERMRFLKRYFDVVRIDHFRGFQATWISRTDAKTAQSGTWYPGPGADLFHAIIQDSPEVIAEDLGVITDDVEELRDHFLFPGMRVIQFLSKDLNNPHRPQNYTENSVVYTATHDCQNLAGWLKQISNEQKQEIESLAQSTQCSSEEPVDQIIEIALKSNANRAIIQIQDLLHLDDQARFNVPGTTNSKNWTWRLTKDQLNQIQWQWLRKITLVSRRSRI